MISWVSTRTRSACAATSRAPSSLCTGRIDSTVTGLSSRATCADAKITFCGTPSSTSRVILRVPGESRTAAASSGPRASRSTRLKRLTGKDLARCLVEHLDPATLIDGHQRARRVVDDRREIAGFDAFLGVPRLEGLQGIIERLPENIEAASAGVGEPLGVVLEAHRFDKSRDQEVRPPDEIPQARKRHRRNQ